MTDCYDFVIGLRAIRDYRDEPLADEHLEAILEAARWTGSSKNRQSWSFVVLTDQSRLDGLAAHGDFTQPLRDAAAAIVLVMEPGGNQFDIGRAAQNIMLAARSLGVASCPVTLHRHAAAREFLGVADDRDTRYAVALGYPAPDAAPRHYGGRKPLAEVVHHDTLL